LIVSVILMLLAFRFRESDTLLSVSLYKAHLLSLGGWGGYWIDWAIFPYARPRDLHAEGDQQALQTASLRRAIIVAASLICIGLAA
ncbi:MAG: putative holin, partial [Glaciimonas sp.]|nr:putative holin [Glaciimonas sp.]